LNITARSYVNIFGCPNANSDKCPAISMAQSLDMNGDVNFSSATARVSIGGAAMYKTAAGEFVIST